MEQPPSNTPVIQTTDDDTISIEHQHVTGDTDLESNAPTPTTPVPDAGPGNAFYSIYGAMFGQLALDDFNQVALPQLGQLERTLASTLMQGTAHKHVVSSDGEQQVELGVVKEEDGEVVCCFSQAPLEVGDETGKLPCEHIFAREDLMKWLRTEQAVCPICRFALDSKEVPRSDGAVTPGAEDDPGSDFRAFIHNALSWTSDDDQMPEGTMLWSTNDDGDGDMPSLIPMPIADGSAAAADEVPPPPPPAEGAPMQPQHWDITLNPVLMLMQAEFERTAAREEEMALQAALWETYAVS
jgi:hypothetical protein